MSRVSFLAWCLRPRSSWVSPEFVHCLFACGRAFSEASRPYPCSGSSQF